MVIPFSNEFHAVHIPWMRRACELSVLSTGHTAPNPMVGAVLVHNGSIVGEGRHLRLGAPHAEVEAIRSCFDPSVLPVSTLYVTLEPCNHHGKTPPCTDLILACHIPNVVVACADPHEKVRGRGLQRLVDAGVEVVLGVLEEECAFVNRRFFTYHSQQRPYVILKWAESADGFVAPAKPGPYWLSCLASRQWVHRWRTEEAAVLVGAGTVLADDPHLGARLYAGRQPIRVLVEHPPILSGQLQILRNEGQLIRIETEAARPLSQQIPRILEQLHENSVLSVLVEAGPHLQQAFIDSGLWDEIRVFTTHAYMSHGLPAAPIPTCAQLYESIPGGGDLLRIYRPNVGSPISEINRIFAP
ncbi:MAG: bifunctional diaminohydroxyphosphoribosylaminopyrimidine deaminase/5-amino-6-(5-phosphoribosylamino)uracil reductase RibD [Sphingomonadales bacterium]|nr:bifunctional diaminohydroxyphosphoribosylaminopyrimidine deaminase/5-amino-6-(5-phosphoribosylamino)uracil reductase RibD [Sphingomonadales bacterium]